MLADEDRKAGKLLLGIPVPSLSTPFSSPNHGFLTTGHKSFGISRIGQLGIRNMDRSAVVIDESYFKNSLNQIIINNFEKVEDIRQKLYAIQDLIKGISQLQEIKAEQLISIPKYFIMLYNYYIEAVTNDINKNPSDELKNYFQELSKIFAIENLYDKIPEILYEIDYLLTMDLKSHYTNKFVILLVIKLLNLTNNHYINDLIQSDHFNSDMIIEILKINRDLLEKFQKSIYFYKNDPVISEILLEIYMKSDITIRAYHDAETLLIPIHDFFSNNKSTEKLEQGQSINSYILNNVPNSIIQLNMNNEKSYVEKYIGCINVKDDIISSIQKLQPKKYNSCNFIFNRSLILITNSCQVPCSFQFNNNEFNISRIIIEIKNSYYSIDSSFYKTNSLIVDIVEKYICCAIYNKLPQRK